MAAYLIVEAEVEEESRDAFDLWYENEHLPDAIKAFEECKTMAPNDPVIDYYLGLL